MHDDLIKLAWESLARAYCPYSNFRVGAALRTSNGDVFTGCNVEVANYGCTLCAERTAIVKAVSEGKLKRGELDVIAISAETDDPTGPCGSCRQMIEEFARPDTLIILTNKPGEASMQFTQRDLLPHAFGPGHLLENP